jgi:hypothetical protein
MSTLRSLARRILRQAGYMILRPPLGVPEGLPSYLRRLEQAGSGPLHVTCVDDDTSIQSQLLRTLPPAQVWFCSPLELHRESLPTAPHGGRRALILGLFPAISPETAADDLIGGDWDALLLRAQLGSFWRHEADLASWIERLDRHGFELEDVISPPSLSPVQSPADSIVIAARRRGPHQSETSAGVGRERIMEAATFLSTPVIDSVFARTLTGRRSFGFSAGIFNPGAIIEDGNLRLLARGETTFWRQQQADETTYFSAVQPCNLSWDPVAGLSSPRSCTWSQAPTLPSWRAEDFRLFRYRAETFTNHSLISRAGGAAVPGRSVEVEKLRCRVALSRVDFRSSQLAFAGFPELDIPHCAIEKNWAVLTWDDRLFLAYAAEPFHLLELADWKRLRFRTVTRSAIRFPFSCPGQVLRNSINPVDYDEDHWLHVVHRVYPGKQYCFWAILINKARLQPAYALSRPLARGGQPFPASVLYLCSAIANPDSIRFFFGVNDAGLGTAEVPRRKLDEQWRRLPA